MCFLWGMFSPTRCLAKFGRCCMRGDVATTGYNQTITDAVIRFSGMFGKAISRNSWVVFEDPHDFIPRTTTRSSQEASIAKYVHAILSSRKSNVDTILIGNETYGAVIIISDGREQNNAILLSLERIYSEYTRCMFARALCQFSFDKLPLPVVECKDGNVLCRCSPSD